MSDIDVTQTAVMAGGGGVTLMAVVTWVLKIIRDQKTAGREDRAAVTVEAGTAKLIDYLQGEVTRLNAVITSLSDDMKTAREAERATALKNVELTAEVTALRADINQLTTDMREMREKHAEELSRRDRRATDVRPEMKIPLMFGESHDE